MNIRNRIKDHRRVRAGDLVPHEWNFRTHPELQRAALQALYEQIGFARSLLAYELPDGRLKLIDGHLRRDLDPDMLVDVEVLDVTEDEARKLLLAIDPLAVLAGADAQVLAELAPTVATTSQEIQDLWDSLLSGAKADPEPPKGKALPEQYLILVECQDEQHQTDLLRKFHADGLSCRALMA